MRSLNSQDMINEKEQSPDLADTPILKFKSLIVKAKIGPSETEKKTNKQSASEQPLLIYDCHLHIPHSCITSYQLSHSDCCRNVHVKAHILNVGVVHTHND